MTKIVRTVNTRELRAQRQDAELEAELAARNAPEPDGEVEPTDPDEKSFKKRYSDLRSFSQKQINDKDKEIAALKTQLADATKAQIKFPKTDDELTEWMQKYPDVAAIVETIAMKKVQEFRNEVDAKNTTLQEREYALEWQRCNNKILAAHEDFPELIKNEVFVDWVDTQPKKIRSAFDPDLEFDELEDAADTIIYAVKLFKMETKPKTEKKPDTNRDAARQVLTRTPATAPDTETPAGMIKESVIMKMTPRELDKIDLLKLQAEGKIIYDISGAAR